MRGWFSDDMVGESVAFSGGSQFIFVKIVLYSRGEKLALMLVQHRFQVYSQNNNYSGKIQQKKWQQSEMRVGVNLTIFTMVLFNFIRQMKEKCKKFTVHFRQRSSRSKTYSQKSNKLEKFKLSVQTTKKQINVRIIGTQDGLNPKTYFEIK